MRKSRMMTWAGLPALMAMLLSIGGLAISVSSAAASTEQHFCWEKTVGPSGVCEQTEAASYNSIAIHAWSESTGFCVWRTITGKGEKVCGEAGQWVTLQLPPGEQFAWPHIENLNKSKSTKVKGILVFNEGSPPPPPASWHYEQLGGEFLDKPTIDATSADHLNILVRGLDGNLWQKFTSGPGTSWGAWQNVSGLSGSGPIASGPGSAAMNSNRLDVVARMPNSTVGHWYSEGGGPWHFDSLGSEQILGEPDIASANNGYLDVVARGLDGNLWMKQWNNGYWGAWSNISAITGGPIAGSPGIVSAISGTLTIVARKPNNHVGVWSVSGSSWGYQELTGEIKGDPDIAAPAPGTPNVNVVAQGLDNRLWQMWTTGAGWNGWQALSGPEIRSSPAAAGGLSASSVLDVVARDSANQLGLWRYGS